VIKQKQKQKTNKNAPKESMGQTSKQIRNKQTKTPCSGSLNFSLTLSSGVTLPVSSPGGGI
jgi:hypothetical protein